MEDKIYKYPDDFEILNAEEYKENVCDHFLHLPNVSNFLIHHHFTFMKFIFIPLIRGLNLAA